MNVFDTKENIDHFAKSVEFDKIAENDYNLSVSSYVEAKDTREVIDITKLNNELKTTVAKIDQLLRIKRLNDQVKRNMALYWLQMS